MPTAQDGEKERRTETPWKVQVEYGDPGIPRNQGGGEKIYICAADGKKVAKPLREFRGTFTPGKGWEKIERPLPEVKSNAALIVMAVNSFEALMEEHRDGECYCLNPEENMGRNPCAWCKVEAILSKSEKV